MAFARMREQINEYAKGKLWYWHVPLWLFGLYLFVEILGFNLIDPQPAALSVMHAFDFMLHEFAHVFTAWLGDFISALAGSGSELLLGTLLVYGAFRFRNYFAMLFCCLWFMLVCMSVGHYMADAVPQQIPLVSLGGALAGSEKTIHDWNYLFGQMGLLDASGFIGGTLRVFGVIVGLFGLIFSAWMIYKMAALSKEKVTTDSERALLNSSLRPDIAVKSVDKNSVYPNPVRGSLAYQRPPQEEQKDKTQK